MRSVKLFIMVAVLFAAAGASVFAQTTVTLQNPSPSTAVLRAVANAGSTVYVAGYNGSFLKSTDGGTTWLHITNSLPSITNNFQGMVFRNANTGYVVGYDSSIFSAITPIVYKTTTAGLSFSYSSSGIAGGTRLHNVFFYSDTLGWVVGENSSNQGEIYYSGNFGASWSQALTGVNLNSDPFAFYGAYFVTSSRGWVVGTDRLNAPADSGLIYRTTNQGTTWTRETNGITGHFDFRNVWFLPNDSVGYVVGEDMDANTAAMFETTNRGISWSRINQNLFGSTTVLRDVKFLPSNPNYGWAVGDSVGVNNNYWEIILATTDGGITWTRQDGNNLPGILYSIDIGSKISAWAVGYSNNLTSLVENYLGGSVWSTESKSIGANSIGGITMLNRSVGYAVSSPRAGTQPRFFSSQNGGFSWASMQYLDGSSNPLFTAGNNEVNSVQFFNNTTGWVAGTNNGYAVLYKTSNGGNSWITPVSINTAPAVPSELFSVDFTGQVTGLAVGVQSGEPSVYYSVDAGADWTTPATGVPAVAGQLNSVTIQPASGVAVGFTGTVGSPTTLILTTTDQGVDWSQQSVGSGNILATASTSSDSVWFGGTWTGGAFIYYTSNATTGTPSWYRANLPSNGISVNSIGFVTNRIGYAVGKNNAGGEWIIATGDGGQNWYQLTDPVLGGNLNSIFATLTNQVDFWAAGSNEAIMHVTVSLPISYSNPSALFNVNFPPTSGGGNNIYRTISDTAQSMMIIANTGTAPLVINPNAISWTNMFDGNVPQDYILPPQLRYGSGLLTVKPGQIDSFIVVFAPKHFGPRTGTLNIPSNSAMGDTMHFSMYGTEGPSSVQFDTTAAYGRTGPLSMHNDTAAVGSFLDDTLFVSNPNGISRLNILKTVINGQNAGDYSIVRNITAPVQTGGSSKIIVRFTPTSGFSRLARLVITSDAQNDSFQVVLLNGYGSCTEDAMSGADTLFKNDTLTFQTSNDTAIQSLLVCNTCASPVTVDSQSITGNPFDYFIADSLPRTIAPGVCDTVKIGFAPNVGTTPLRSGQFIVKTNARTSGTLSRELGGVGCTQFAALTDTTFGDTVQVGDSVLYTSFITNTGICPITIDSIHWANINDYVLVTGPLAGSTLQPGGTDTIVVKFVAKKLDTMNAHLSVYTNATNNPPTTITYSDTSVTPTSVKEPGVVVNDYSLSQNYPNPFNPSTMIRYAIPSRQMVTVDVVNSLGEVVAAPVHEMEDAGQYHFTFSAYDLPNGVYIYRLHAGTTTIARTMSLIR